MTTPRGGRRRTDPAPKARDLQEHTETLHQIVGHIHDYWLRTFGEPPRIEDSVTIIGVIAALDEFHAERCTSGAGLVTISLPAQHNRNHIRYY